MKSVLLVRFSMYPLPVSTTALSSSTSPIFYGFSPIAASTFLLNTPKLDKRTLMRLSSSWSHVMHFDYVNFLGSRDIRSSVLIISVIIAIEESVASSFSIFKTHFRRKYLIDFLLWQYLQSLANLSYASFTISGLNFYCSSIMTRQKKFRSSSSVSVNFK